MSYLLSSSGSGAVISVCELKLKGITKIQVPGCMCAVYFPHSAGFFFLKERSSAGVLPVWTIIYIYLTGNKVYK